MPVAVGLKAYITDFNEVNELSFTKHRGGNMIFTSMKKD